MNFLILRNLLPENIKQKTANLNMKDQYPQGNTLNEQQEEWKETHTSSNISRNSTKRYKPIASRKKISANLHRTNRPHRR